MTTGHRPGGLTALAVLNLIFGAANLLGSAGYFVFLPLLKMAADDPDLSDQQREQIEALQQLGDTWFIVIVILGAVGAILLLISGVGYLKQKRVLGRGVGNAYVLLSLIGTGLAAAMMPQALGGSFSLGTIIGLIYPLITVYCINEIGRAHV